MTLRTAKSEYAGVKSELAIESVTVAGDDFTEQCSYRELKEHELITSKHCYANWSGKSERYIPENYIDEFRQIAIGDES